MTRTLAAILAVAALVAGLSMADVHAFGLGKEGAMFGRMGRAVMKQGAGGTQPSGCPGPGQLDFSDVCQTNLVPVIL